MKINFFWIKKKLFCGIIRENKILLDGMWLKKRLFCGINRENKTLWLGC